ncbi:MAG: metallophosphoesterase family protein [Candidatus Thorarchaeota archaeon]
MRALVLSDLHLGNPESKWLDAAYLIKENINDLDIIILNGDLTEEFNPFPITRKSVHSDLELLNSNIHESLSEFRDIISENINKMVFLRGNHDHLIINSLPIVENFAILQTKFKKIVIFHGHQTYLSQYGKRFGWGVEAGRRLKSRLDQEHYVGTRLDTNDYIIVGHCHTAFFDNEAKIFSPGCWVGKYRNRNIGWYILINDEGEKNENNFIEIRRIKGFYSKACKCGYDDLKNDDSQCPKCDHPTTPICITPGCSRPVRGEDEKLCKRCNHDEFNFYE